MYFILLLFLILTLIIIIPIFKFEILCPPIVCVLIFLLCASFGLLRYYDWELYDYSGIAVGYLILALTFFIIGSVIALICKGQKRVDKTAQPQNFARINLTNSAVGCLTLLGIINDLGFLIHIKETVNAYGRTSSNFSNLLFNYYTLKTYQNVSAPAIWKYSNILASASAIIAIYILIYNFCIKKFKKKDVWLFVVVALNLGHSFLDSSRGEMMLLLAEALYLFYFFWGMFYHWKKEINKKIIKWGIGALIGMIAAFVVLAIGMGRRQSFDDLDTVKYLTVYTSGGIRNFDLFVKEPEFSNQFGKETFYALNRFLANRFGIGELYNSPLEFRSIGEMSTGNIYTSFRRYYADFGIIGLILLPNFLGIIFTWG